MISNRKGVIHILDVDNPDTIPVLGTYTVNGEIEKMFIHDTKAYIVFRGDFLILDISNPAYPDSLGNYKTGSPKVQFAYPYAYFISGRSFQIVNVSNPKQPHREVCYNAGYFKTFRVIGETAFLLDPIDNLHVLNISNPARPEPIPFGPLNYRVSFLCADGSTVYAFRVGGLPRTPDPAKKTSDAIPGIECRFRFIDLGSLVHRYPRLVRICPANDYVYCARGEKGMMILDMRNPQLSWLAVNHPGTPVNALSGIDSNLLMGTDNNICVADLSNPVKPRIIGTMEIPEGVSEISATGYHAVILSKKGAITIVDCTNPAFPIPAGSCTILTKKRFTHCAAVENKVYLTDSTNGLYIINIKNPLKPWLVGKYHEKMEGKDFAYHKIFAVATDIILSYSYYYQKLRFGFELGLAQVSNGTRKKTAQIDASNPAHPVKKQDYASHKNIFPFPGYVTWTSDRNNMETGAFWYYNVFYKYDCDKMDYPYFYTIDKNKYTPEFIDVTAYKIWR